jgi:hypothetical protein
MIRPVVLDLKGADSGESRPRIRDDLTRQYDLISLGVTG